MNRMWCVLLVGLLSQTLNAVLISVEDGLILRDTDTGLDWLHLSKTFDR